MTSVTLSLDDARDLARRAFARCGVSDENARVTADALVAAEADGQKGHGLARIPSYCEQVRSGKVKGNAVPQAHSISTTAISVDADFGFAYPALNLAIDELAPRALQHGVSIASIRQSHHFGQAGAHAEKLAERGLIAFIFGNSPKAIAFWGSAKPAMGTNPIAFAAPTPGGPPLVIDLALSIAARGKIIAAEKNGEPIPEGWALDANGQPTTDPSAALAGSMMPVGDAKGAALALMVEIMAAAVTGSHYGFEASSLFTPEGAAPNLGQVLLVLNPALLSGGQYIERIAVLLEAIDHTEGARLPGTRRLKHRERAHIEGVELSEPLYQEITEIIAGTD